MKKALATFLLLAVVITAGFDAQSKPVASGQTHTVKAGEDVYNVAVRYGVAPTAIRALNNLSSPDLTEGQVLKIPKAGEPLAQRAKAAGVALSRAQGQAEPVADDGYETYTVKAGEDIYTVAVRQGVSPSDLKQLNNLSSPELTVGQVLKIPKAGEPPPQTEARPFADGLQPLRKPWWRLWF